MKRVLHPHQERAIERLRQSLGVGKRRPILQAPTGSGKTIIAAAIVESALAKRKRVLFTVPLLSLVDQTVERFFEEGIYAVGVMQGYHPMTDFTQPIQVASVQTLARRAVPPCDLVLIDEAHRQFDFVTTWLASPEMANVPAIGLSATPWSHGLGKTFDDLIVCARLRELIDVGILCDFRTFAPSHPDLAGVRTIAGDYHEGELSQAMSKAALVADVVSTWIKLGQNRPTLVFAVDLAHARLLVSEFEAAGIAAAYIDAFTESRDRARIFDDYRCGAVKVIVSVATLTCGVDLPNTACIVLARPTKSEMLFVQIAGRGLRIADGKTDCLILDHSDNTLRLGFPDQIHHDELDDGSPRASSQRKENEEPKPKECPACHFLKPPRVHKCPSCGFAPERQANVTVIDGDLSEIDAAKANRIHKADRNEKQRWYSMLRWIALQRGYKPGWVANQYRAKFEVWPCSMVDISIPADIEVSNWVRSRLIRHAKAKAKARAA